MEGSGLGGGEKRRGGLRNALAYFGLTDASDSRTTGGERAASDETAELLRALERRVAENTAAIDALRAEITRLRARP
jgi:hypothetical protein